jgi:hypothetical protein
MNRKYCNRNHNPGHPAPGEQYYIFMSTLYIYWIDVSVTREKHLMIGLDDRVQKEATGIEK